MKATQILLLSVASLLMFAGCNNKKESVVSGGTILDTTAIIKEIFYKLPNESSPGEFSPDQRRQLLTMPGDQQLTSDNGKTAEGMANALSKGSKGLSTMEWFGEDGFHNGWAMACYFVEDSSEVLALVANTFADAPTFGTLYLRAFRYDIATGELTSIKLPFEAFTEKELIDDNKILNPEKIKSVHQSFKEGNGVNLIYSIQPDGIRCSFSLNEDDEELGYFEENGPFPTVRRVWTGRQFVKEIKSKTSDKEGFTMTITGKVFSSYITAQSLTIDWGDGTTETFESCDKRSIKHTYKESESHTVTAIAENLTYLDCSGNQLTGLDISKNPELSELNCWMNQLTNLDVSKNPKLKTVSCGNNELPAKAINAIFNDLPENLCGRIDLAGNPGNDKTCDAFLAERKGWRVFFYENYGSLEVELIAYENALEQSAEEEFPKEDERDNTIWLKQASPDFRAFIKKFFADEDNYQISHIQFPLTSNVSNAALERKDWCSIGWGHILEGEVGVGNITYRGVFGQPDQDQYVYTLHNGKHFIYILIFEKINGKWMMTEFRLGGD